MCGAEETPRSAARRDPVCEESLGTALYPPTYSHISTSVSSPVKWDSNCAGGRGKNYEE